MQSKPTIIVTGANGQLGKSLQDLAAQFPAYQFSFFNREEYPIDNREIGETIFSSLNPLFCINCAAYTAVDKAETERDISARINGIAPGILASLARSHNARLIHISTDYVFNGTASVPYKETDPVDPVNAYGAGKLKGEQTAMQEDSHSIIIRTSWVYATHGNNFVKTMLRLMKEKEEISVVSDQLGSPTYAPDLANAIMQIVIVCTDTPDRPGGIYHYSNEGIISWYDFACTIRDISDSRCRVLPIPTSAYPTPAKRPAYSAMDKTKIVQDFRLSLSPWKSSLEICMKTLV